MIPLPPGWKETIKPRPCFGSPCGYYWRDQKKIVIYSPTWLSGWRLKAFIYLTRKHERGHAWGIKGCKKPWCLMFEAGEWSPEWKDTWWEKLFGPLMLLNGFRFCKSCQSIIEHAQEKGQPCTK